MIHYTRYVPLFQVSTRINIEYIVKNPTELNIISGEVRELHVMKQLNTLRSLQS
jgi:hypothetical protein